MVRRARVEIEGGLYHVYNRISSGEHLFSDPNEAIEFVEIARDVKKRKKPYHLTPRARSRRAWNS